VDGSLIPSSFPQNQISTCSGVKKRKEGRKERKYEKERKKKKAKKREK
jgi:hypothetical protein